MIRQLFEGFREFKDANFTFRDVTIYGFIVLVTVGGFYLYRMVDTLEFKYDRLEKATEQTISDLFSIQIGVPYEAIQQPIRDASVRAQESTQADWVLLLGVHNGDVFGPFHLKKLSLIEEIKAQGLDTQLRRFQSIPVNLYDNFSVFNTNPDTIITSTYRELAVESRFRYPAIGWREYGIQSYIAAPIFETVRGQQKLIGIVGFYYRSNEIESNGMCRRCIIREIKLLKATIENEIEMVMENKSTNVYPRDLPREKN